MTSVLLWMHFCGDNMQGWLRGCFCSSTEEQVKKTFSHS